MYLQNKEKELSKVCYLNQNVNS